MSGQQQSEKAMKKSTIVSFNDDEDKLNDDKTSIGTIPFNDYDENNFVLEELNHDTDPIIIDCICRICSEEWGGSINQRRERLLMNDDNGYVFLNNSVVYGYGNMKKGIRSSHQDQDMGNDETKTAILYSIIIASAYRGLGLGSRMMMMIEREAARQNYDYLYLYTYNASDFYKKLKYHKCEAIAAHRPAFNFLREKKLDAIESILLRRLSPSDSINIDEKYIWYRKRLRFSLDFKIIYNSTLYKQINDKHLIPIDDIHIIDKNICYFEQLGPCCGISCLCSSILTITGDYSVNISQSLLEHAISRGFSNDGELFDINNLNELAHIYSDNISSEVLETSIFLNPIFLKKQFEDNKIVILPYDRGQSHMPDRLRGNQSHYAMIIGYIEDENAVSLIGLQGLSSSCIIAPLNDWLGSNSQLFNYNLSKEFSVINGPNLRDKMLLISKK
jgi:ribosomal protein S18 acetylase RimI-like enzyme